MIWVVIFAGIAVAGLIMVVSYVIWLAHKASDVMSEVGVLGDRAGQLMELVSQIDVPERRFGCAGPGRRRAAEQQSHN